MPGLGYYKRNLPKSQRARPGVRGGPGGRLDRAVGAHELHEAAGPAVLGGRQLADVGVVIDRAARVVQLLLAELRKAGQLELAAMIADASYIRAFLGAPTPNNALAS